MSKIAKKNLTLFFKKIVIFPKNFQFEKLMITRVSEWINQVLSLTGKFGASAGFAVIYIYSAEIFPTVMRNSGLGMSSFFARIGGVAAPYIADLVMYQCYLY